MYTLSGITEADWWVKVFPIMYYCCCKECSFFTISFGFLPSRNTIKAIGARLIQYTLWTVHNARGYCIQLNFIDGKIQFDMRLVLQFVWKVRNNPLNDHQFKRNNKFYNFLKFNFFIRHRICDKMKWKSLLIHLNPYDFFIITFS